MPGFAVAFVVAGFFDERRASASWCLGLRTAANAEGVSVAEALLRRRET
jgi:hypothetical protein